ncbi:MAG: hypothetical protein AAGE01_17505 [Pseudomonadota bacterium]
MRISTLLLLLICTTSVLAEEMTLDALLAGNIEARGGYENWKAVETAHMTGTMLMGPGLEAPFRIWFKRPQQVRMEFDVQGMTGIQAYDGEQGWYVLPFMGSTEPARMGDDQLKDILDTADFDGPLVDWREKGHAVAFLGAEEVDGQTAYALRLTKSNGDTSMMYFDADDLLEFKQTARTSRQGAEVVVHTVMGDYRSIDGLVMPHSMQLTFEGMPVAQAITIDSVELNVVIGAERFTMPAPAAAGAE